MPQINQLAEIFFSQLFWLLLVFGIIYFGIAKGMVPKIQSTVALREAKIAEDLERAQAARAAAEQTEQAWRDRMDAARAEAAKLAQEAKQAAARDTEDKTRKAVEKIAVKVDKAETKIREALVAARGEIEAVASDAAQDLVARLTGIRIDHKDAAAAVKAELHG